MALDIPVQLDTFVFKKSSVNKEFSFLALDSQGGIIEYLFRFNSETDPYYIGGVFTGIDVINTYDSLAGPDIDIPCSFKDFDTVERVVSGLYFYRFYGIAVFSLRGLRAKLPSLDEVLSEVEAAGFKVIVY